MLLVPTSNCHSYQRFLCRIVFRMELARVSLLECLKQISYHIVFTLVATTNSESLYMGCVVYCHFILFPSSCLSPPLINSFSLLPPSLSPPSLSLPIPLFFPSLLPFLLPLLHCPFPYSSLLSLCRRYGPLYAIADIHSAL